MTICKDLQERKDVLHRRGLPLRIYDCLIIRIKHQRPCTRQNRFADLTTDQSFVLNQIKCFAVSHAFFSILISSIALQDTALSKCYVCNGCNTIEWFYYYYYHYYYYFFYKGESEGLAKYRYSVTTITSRQTI